MGNDLSLGMMALLALAGAKAGSRRASGARRRMRRSDDRDEERTVETGKMWPDETMANEAEGVRGLAATRLEA